MYHFFKISKKIFVFLSILSIIGLMSLRVVEASFFSYDSEFATDGYLMWDYGVGDNEAVNKIIIDSSGKYVTAGYVYEGDGDQNIMLTRFNLDGTIDTGFGTGGYVVADNFTGMESGFYDLGLDIVQQSDGKYVITGSSSTESGETSECDMFVARYNNDGTLDETFGVGMCPGTGSGNGCFVHDNAAGGEYGDRGMAVAIQSDGKIVVTGHSYSYVPGEDADLVIWRFNPNGTLDESFGDGSCYNGVGESNAYGCVVNINSSSETSYAWQKGTTLKIQADGKYVIGGWSYSGDVNYGAIGIWRYNNDGTMDSSFGDGTCVSGVGTDGAYGCVIKIGVAGGEGCDKLWGLQIDSLGRIIAVGQAGNANGDADMAIWRYTSTGQLDTTFNSVGYFTHHSASGGDSGDRANAIAIDPSGRYVVTGRSYNNDESMYNMVVWRLNTDGTLDDQFGNATCNNGVGLGSDMGCVVYDADMNSVWSRQIQGSSVVIDSLGRYIIAGSDYNFANENYDLAMWRMFVKYDILSPDTTYDIVVDTLNTKDTSWEGDIGQVVVQIWKDGRLVASVTMNLYEDKDWSLLTAGSSTTEFKSFIHNLTTLSGASSFSLYVPFRTGDKAVAVCPGATSLAEVTETCPNVYYRSLGDAGVSIVEIGGVSYWKVDGVTGSGGLSVDDLPRETLTQTGQSVLILQFLGLMSAVGVRILGKKGEKLTS